ncbi:hypothetical protein ACSBL2_15780 [Pedobacter sp. AW31-3R]|uniref:hypothetical protein n=1 Tax=Pedobacter sp. AW31-3R TaxID=3445781 RepID=UPI003F9FCB01
METKKTSDAAHEEKLPFSFTKEGCSSEKTGKHWQKIAAALSPLSKNSDPESKNQAAPEQGEPPFPKL